MIRPLRLISGTGVLLVYAIVFVIGLEATARVDDALRYGAPVLASFGFDELLDHDARPPGNRPGSRYRHWVINRHGFRGPEIATPKPAGRRRVAVAGASEIFGLYESPGRDVAASLQRELDARAPGRFEVVNVASPGMTPPRLTETVRARLAPLEIDAVVLYLAPALYLDTVPPPDVGTLPPPKGRRPARSLQPRLPERVWTAARSGLPQGVQVRLKTMAIERVRRGHDAAWLWDTPPADRLAKFQAHARELVEAVQGQEARAIVATHANRFRGPGRQHEDPAGLVGWVRFYPRATGECILDMDDAGNEALRAIATRHGAPLVDVAAALGGRPALFADFSHFTDAGAEAAARLMADRVLEVLGATNPAPAPAAGGER